MVAISFGGDEEGHFYDASKDEFSQIAGAISGGSYSNSTFVSGHRLGHGHRSDRAMAVRTIFRDVLTNFWVYPDGVGTKVIALASLGNQPTAAYDIVAMTGDDAVQKGDYITSFNSVLDLRNASEEKEKFIAMMRTLGEIARQHKFILFSGETANLGACVSTTDPESKSAFNWSGFATSVKHPMIHHAKMMNMTNFGKVEPGNIVVALKQEGFRSNGISAVRRAFEAKFGPNWYREAPWEDLKTAFQASQIYSRAVGEAMGWFNNFSTVEHDVRSKVSAEEFTPPVDIRAIAHLSGGAFKGKFLRWVLDPNGVSAQLNGLYPTPDIVKKVVEWQKMVPEKLERKADVTTLEEVYETFCSGQGMLVVVGNSEKADKLIKIMQKNGIDAQVAGMITENTKSQGSKLNITGDQISLN